MRTQLKEVQGIDWLDGAIMNCKWKGPRLRDVLIAAGLNIDKEVEKMKKQFVAFECHQVECQDDSWFGGSVELDRCMREEDEVILALEVRLLSPCPPQRAENSAESGQDERPPPYPQSRPSSPRCHPRRRWRQMGEMAGSSHSAG